jgi:hypothetical protein
MYYLAVVKSIFSSFDVIDKESYAIMYTLLESSQALLTFRASVLDEPT